MLVAWTFHDEELRRVVVRAAPSTSTAVTVQLLADAEVWRARFTADPARAEVNSFYENRFSAAQAMDADLRIDTGRLGVEEIAAQVAELTSRR